VNISIHEELSGIRVDIDIQDRFCIFFSASGTGKTFLFELLEKYCISNDISVALVDYRDCKNEVESICSKCRGKRLVILDNADLYITADLLREICENAEVVLTSIKSVPKLHSVKGTFYRVEYTSGKLSVSRR